LNAPFNFFKTHPKTQATLFGTTMIAPSIAEGIHHTQAAIQATNGAYDDLSGRSTGLAEGLYAMANAPYLQRQLFALDPRSALGSQTFKEQLMAHATKINPQYGPGVAAATWDKLQAKLQGKSYADVPAPSIYQGAWAQDQASQAQAMLAKLEAAQIQAQKGLAAGAVPVQ
jgi:hypothetical protein